MSVETQLARAQQQLELCAARIHNQRAEIVRLENSAKELAFAFNRECELYQELRRETDGGIESMDHSDAVRSIRDTKNAAADLQAKLAEYDALFDLQHKRTSEADALYVAAHPRPEYPHGYRPDLGTLIEWLLKFHAHVKDLSCDCHDDYGTPRKQPCDRCRLLGKKIVTYRAAAANLELCLRDRLTMLQRCQVIYDYLVETQGRSEPPEAIYHSDPSGGLEVVWELFWAAKQHFTGLVPRVIRTETPGRAVGDIVWENLATDDKGCEV